MHLQQLKFFVTVAQYEHFSRAAEALDISQPALSSAIKKLEDELGVPLFERHGRNIRLGIYGKAFLEEILPAIQQIDKAVNSMQEMKQALGNKVTIVAPPLYSFPSLVTRLRQEFPTVTIHNVDCPYNKIHQLLVKSAVDFCILARPISTDDIESAILTEDELVMLVPKNHRFQNHSRVPLSEFSREHFADYSAVSAIQSERENLCWAAGFQSRVAYEGRTLYDLIDAVRGSGCVALLPYRVLGRYDLADTKVIFISSPECKSNLYLYWKAGRTERPIVKEVRTAVLNHFREYRKDPAKTNPI